MRITFKHRSFILFILLLLSPLCVEAQDDTVPPGTLDEAITIFRQGHSEEAETALLRLLESGGEKQKLSEIHAWLAAIYKYRRMGMSYKDLKSVEEYYRIVEDLTNKSLESIERSLEYNPCNGMAYSLLSDSYNPQYSGSERTDTTLAWMYITRAVQCDAHEESAWMSIMIQAMRKGEKEWEQKAMKALADSNCIPQVYLDYARLTLQSLPDNALYITFGDMDTYSMLALQAEKGLRTDVNVICYPLLDMKWYAEEVSKRSHIPLSDSLLESIRESLPEDQQEEFLMGKPIIEYWIALSLENRLGRPLCFDRDIMSHAWKLAIPPFVKHYGTFVEYYDPEAETPLEEEMVIYSDDESAIAYSRSAMERLHQHLGETLGPIVAANDYSPIRASGYGISYGPLVSLQVFANLLLQKDGASARAKVQTICEDAIKVIERARTFVYTEEAEQTYQELLHDYRYLQEEADRTEQE